MNWARFLTYLAGITVAAAGAAGLYFLRKVWRDLQEEEFEARTGGGHAREHGEKRRSTVQFAKAMASYAQDRFRRRPAVKEGGVTSPGTDPSNALQKSSKDRFAKIRAIGKVAGMLGKMRAGEVQKRSKEGLPVQPSKELPRPGRKRLSTLG